MGNNSFDRPFCITYMKLSMRIVIETVHVFICHAPLPNAHGKKYVE